MAALPSLKQLRYFLAIATELNFTRAAEVCFVGQSTLSAGLKELEDTLGVRLVERDRQNVSITPIGLEVLVRAKGILASADDLVDYVGSASGPMTGTIRLGVIPTIAPFLLPAILPTFRTQYPNLKLALREDLTQHLITRVLDHQLDFAIIALPYPTEGLLVKPLFNDEFWLAARADDPAFKGRDVQLPAKLADRLLLLEEGHCLRDHSLQACKRTEIASAEGMEATSLLTLIQMVESGLGIALIPEMAVKGGLLNGTQLVARPLTAPAPKRVIALVGRTSTARIDAYTALAKAVQNHFGASTPVSKRIGRTVRSSALSK
ncbi:MAG: LysR substrate-binding domain-containing protein [Polynucleobacter sp.]|nr:LysR substrate-binding domain-containing protein [Polynucleobacter sp.]